MGWDLRHIGRDVEHFFRDVGQSIGDTFRAIEKEIVATVRDLPKELEHDGKDLYNNLIGDKLKIIGDKHAPLGDRLLALGELVTEPLDLPAIEKTVLQTLEGDLKAHGVQLAGNVLKDLQRHGDTVELLAAEIAVAIKDPAMAAQLKTQGLNFSGADKIVAIATGVIGGLEQLPTELKTSFESIGKIVKDPTISETDRERQLKAAITGIQTTLSKDATAIAQIPQLPADLKAALAELAPQGHVVESHGTKLIETADRMIDIVAGSTLTTTEALRLAAIAQDHSGKPLTIVGPHLDAVSNAQLREAGLTVAIGKDQRDLLDRARLVPGGIDLLRTAGVDGPAKSRDTAVAMRDELSPADVEQARRTGPAEIGLPHLEALRYDGGTHDGSVTSVAPDRVEQYIGGRQWVAYDDNALRPLIDALATNRTEGNGSAPTTIEVGDRLTTRADGSIGLTPKDQSLDAITIDSTGAIELGEQRPAAAVSRA